MTKKLLGLSLLAIFLLIGTALAQDTAFFWFGGSFDGLGNWNDTVKCRINANNDVPVFHKGTEGAWVANLHLPLGVNLTYIDAIPKALCEIYDPIAGTGWDDKSFLDTFEVTPPCPAGWRSRSFFGIAYLVDPPNPPMHITGIPQKIMKFVVHTLDNAAFIGNLYTDGIAAGVSNTLGVAAAGDSLGGAGFPVKQFFGNLFFSANQPPEIGDVTIPACLAGGGAILFHVTDADGNYPLTVTSSVGTVTEISHTGGGILPTDVIYQLTFPCQFSADEITINATDGADPAIPKVITGPFTNVVTAWMNDSFPMWPGYSDWMPVYLNDPCCVGGFEFTIVYDPSVLTILDVRREAAIAAGEYWYVNYHPAVPGCEGNYGAAIKVTFINDLNNQIPAQEICGLVDEPIFSIKWLVNPAYEYPVDFCIPICFYLCEPVNYNWNAVSDETGIYVWKTEGCLDALATTFFLDLNCGNIKIQHNGDVIPGDVNHNLQPWEIGDVVLLANYLMDPIGHPLDMWQKFAADLNGNGYPDIADLIYMINIINGTIPIPGKLAPLDVPATVAFSGNNVTITSDLPIGGAVVEINHTGELGVPTANGMKLIYTDNGSVMRVVVYDGMLSAGTNTLFTVNGTGTIGEVSVSDNVGHLLNAKAGKALPTAFSVEQNYPNPFNAKTAIKFALPTSANVTVTVYNVAGQVVQTINAGQMSAGDQSVIWDASNVGSGVYFYKVAADGFSKTLKATLLK